jgi:hypothetical protein
MPDTLFIFTPDNTCINIQWQEVYRLMGYKNEVTKDIQLMSEKCWDQIKPKIQVQCGFKIIPVQVGIKNLMCGNIELSAGKMVVSHLKNCLSIAVFVATIGKEISDRIKDFFNKNEPLTGFITDTLGSVAVESVVDWLEIKIAEIVKKKGFTITNRFSPGYCNWHVKEQQKLFSLLPENFCSISLTHSSLMIPEKSVSGIIGIGEGVKKKDYGCDLCDKYDCIMRKNIK